MCSTLSYNWCFSRKFASCRVPWRLPGQRTLPIQECWICTTLSYNRVFGDLGHFGATEIAAASRRELDFLEKWPFRGPQTTVKILQLSEHRKNGLLLLKTMIYGMKWLRKRGPDFHAFWSFFTPFRRTGSSKITKIQTPFSEPFHAVYHRF